MPLTELDPNISGRNSRASGTSSARTRDSTKRHGGGKADPLSTAPGVKSMLRTTTEIGDVGSLALPSRNNRFAQSFQRTSGRTSAGSTHSGPSHTRSNHHAWPSASSAPRRSITSNYTMPDDLIHEPPSISGGPSTLLSPQLRREDRSSSPSNDLATPPFVLVNHRSMTSLRMHDPHSRTRSPLVYPTRLKRPGYRVPSPALSDITGMQYSRPPPAMIAPHDRTQHIMPMPQGSHNMRLPYPQVRTISAPSDGEGVISIHALPSRPSPPMREATSSAPPIMAPAPLRVRRAALRPVPLATPGPHLPRAPSTSPATPDPTGSSLEVVASALSGTDFTTVTQPTSTALQSDLGPAYYDYSESFHPRYAKSSNDLTIVPPRSPPAVPSGFVHRIRSLLEDREIDHQSPASSDGFAPGSALSELPGHRSLVELPADDVPEAIRRMRQAQAAHATVHAENMTMESIAHLITDVREQNDLDDAPQSNTSSPSRNPSSERRGANKKGKRLSIISEAASNITKSTNHSTAIDLAIRYSAAVTANSPKAQPLPRSPPREEVNSEQDRKRETGQGSALTDQDETPRHSTDDVLDEPSTGSIKVATEVIFERKREELSLLEPRGTPERPKSMIVTSSTPSHRATRRSAPIGRTTWIEPDVEATSSDDTPSDIAVRISMPNMPNDTNMKISSPLSIIETVKPVGLDVSETSVKPVVLSITQATNTLTVEAAPPVSPMMDDSLYIQNNSPVSPLVTTSVIVSPLPSQKSPLSKDDQAEGITTEPAHNVSRRALQGNSRGTDSSSSTIKDVLAQYSDALDMSTTDLRFSQLRHPAGTAKPLPNLQEESGENSSIADFRISNFKFPKPGQARRSSFDSAIGRMSKESTRSGRASAVVRVRSSALAEIRSIPSLQFSSSNLIEKLNSALGQGYGRSLADIQLGDSPQARKDFSDMRERYRSFFASLDDFDHLPRAPAFENGKFDTSPEPQDMSTDVQPETPEEALTGLQDPVTNNQALQQFQRPSIHMIQRPLSPQDIIDEVNRLTVPEVNSLTQRLSDMIPSLKRFIHSTEITKDGTVELTLNEIRSLGRRRIVRADGRVISLVKEDSWELPEQPTPMDYHNRSSTPSSSGSRRSSIDNVPSPGQSSRSVDNKVLKAPGTAVSGLAAEPVVQLPAPIVTRGRSLTDSYGVVRAPSKIHLDSHEFRRSPGVMVTPRSTSFDIRPWNLDESYPWANTNVDISFPSRTFQRDSPKLGPSKLRNNESNDGDSSHRSKDKDAKQDIVDAEENTRTTEDTFSSQRRRRSVIGTVARRIGNTLSLEDRHRSGASKADATTSSMPIDSAGFPLNADLLSLRIDERVVDPGDRYPTTGLSPPNTFNLDEVRSFFSDDSSIHETGAREGLGISKRFTRLRLGMTRAASAMDTRHGRTSEGHRLEAGFDRNGVRSAASARGQKYLQVLPGGRTGSALDADGPFDGAVSPSLTTGYDGSRVQGMGKTEFRTQRLIERIKVLWFKGGELIRTLSGRAKRDVEDAKTGLGYGFAQERRKQYQDGDMYSGA